MSDHGVYYDRGPERAYSEPRCPRCSSWTLRATGDRWWCLDCDLVVTCTQAEWNAMAEERTLWAKGEHPGQREPAPPPPRVDVPHEHAPCQVCGELHAIAPDPRAHKPRTDQRAGARRWDATPRRPPQAHDPDGHTLAWPHGTPDEPYEPPTTGALDPIEAEKALLDDMDDHRERRSA